MAAIVAVPPLPSAITPPAPTPATTPAPPVIGELDAFIQDRSSVIFCRLVQLFEIWKSIRARRKIFRWKTDPGLGVTRQDDRKSACARNAKQTCEKHSSVHSCTPPNNIHIRVEQ
jgi:hypothetical protein